jgi:hypothetical protein
MPLRSSLLAVVFSLALLATAGAAHAQSPAPILVVDGPDRIGGPGDDFGRYLPEILRAEGLNEIATLPVASLDAAALSGRSVVILAPTAVSDAQAATLTAWVQAGGQLIAMRPDPKLAPLLGLGADAGDVPEGYIAVDTSAPPGSGITGATMQFHGTADRWTGAVARSVATLYSDAASSTGAPAVTLHEVGTQGGKAASFAYDLARSVVQTRQGNPAWVGQEHDRAEPDGSPQVLRASDLFVSGNPSVPDWVAPSKIAIPQADEQQRLLANLIGQMSLERMPLPRFWYLPRGEKAAVVLTGDDHSSGRTKDHFTAFAARNPGCSVADWACVRATSYLYPDGPLTDAEAKAFQDAGFELALHFNSGTCSDAASDDVLTTRLGSQLTGLKNKWPSLVASRTNRTHCAVWRNWAGMAKVEANAGIRLDTNYYYFPATWALARPGLFTGSGFPMRFADTDGSLIETYQATTQVTDELGLEPWGHVGTHIAALLDGALGANGYYGTFTVNMHTDEIWPHEGAVAVVDAAQARGVPVISAAQLLTWLDGRNGSGFAGMSYAGGQLSFTVTGGANGLEAMVPAAATGGALISLTRDGAPVATTPRTVKGVEYRVFDGVPGAYVAGYPPPPVRPGPPAGPAGETPATDVTAPRIRVKPRRARVSRKGKVTLKLACPKAEVRCRIDLRLSRSGKRLARKRLTVAGGRTAKAVLRLPKSTRRRLARDRKLRARLTLRVTDAAGNARTQKMKLTLLAPASKS